MSVIENCEIAQMKLSQGLTLLYHLLQHGENKNVFRKDTKRKLSSDCLFECQNLTNALVVNIKVIEDLKDYNYFKEQGTLVNDIRLVCFFM